MTSTGAPPREIARVEPPRQFRAAPILNELVQVTRLIRLDQARQQFKVSGDGLTVAVLDTGLRTTHVDFAGRVRAQRNFTSDGGGAADDVSDGNGHGTNVGGIIAASGVHTGVAPKAGIIPLKVLRNNGGGTFDAVEQALGWVAANRDAHNITAVCMSLSDSGNYTSDDQFANDGVRQRIQALRAQRVAVVVAGGNDYFTHASAQGMGYPAVCRECVSVGAVYDEDEGPFSYASGAMAFSTAPDRITPFSQRLHPSVSAALRTDVFAPGAPVTSSGISGDGGFSIQQGTSQAAPVVAGVVLLMQELHRRMTTRLPEVDALVEWMRAGGVPIVDGDDEHDNVKHTNLTFTRVDVAGALDAVVRQVQKSMLTGEFGAELAA